MRYSIWLLVCCRCRWLQSISSCSFGQGYFVCQWSCRTFPFVSCDSEWHNHCCCPANYFILFISLFKLCINFGDCLISSSIQLPCSFLFLICLSLQMLCPVIGSLVFWVFYPYLLQNLVRFSVDFSHGYPKTSDSFPYAAYNSILFIW